MLAYADLWLNIAMQTMHRSDERYAAIPSREHEYYTFIRESWNARVVGFRNTVLDILHAKK